MRESIPQRDRTRMGERSSRWSAGTDRPTHQTAKRDGIRAESRTQLQPKKSPGRDRSASLKRPGTRRKITVLPWVSTNANKIFGRSELSTKSKVCWGRNLGVYP